MKKWWLILQYLKIMAIWFIYLFGISFKAILGNKVISRYNTLRYETNLNMIRQPILFVSVRLVILHHFVRGVQDFLNHEHRVFNSEEFLRTREPADQSFYQKVHSHLHAQTYAIAHTRTLTICAACFSWCPQVLETHIFHSFLRDRLNRKRDTFTRMEQNTRSHAHRYYCWYEGI